jgi:hypothetical protein
MMGVVWLNFFLHVCRSNKTAGGTESYKKPSVIVALKFRSRRSVTEEGNATRGMFCPGLHLVMEMVQIESAWRRGRNTGIERESSTGDLSMPAVPLCLIHISLNPAKCKMIQNYLTRRLAGKQPLPPSPVALCDPFIQNDFGTTAFSLSAFGWECRLHRRLRSLPVRSSYTTMLEW